MVVPSPRHCSSVFLQMGWSAARLRRSPGLPLPPVWLCDVTCCERNPFFSSFRGLCPNCCTHHKNWEWVWSWCTITQCKVVSDLGASLAVFLTLLTQEVFLPCYLVLSFNIQINVLEPVAVTVSISAASWRIATDTFHQVSYLRGATQNTEREIKIPPDYLCPQIPHSFSSCGHDLIPQHVLIDKTTGVSFWRSQVLPALPSFYASLNCLVAL